MASSYIALSKPRLIKHIFSKPFYRFSSSANEQNPVPNPHHLTHDPYKTKQEQKTETLSKYRSFSDVKQFILSLPEKGIDYREDLFYFLFDGYTLITKKRDARNCIKNFLKMDELDVSKTVKFLNQLLEMFSDKEIYRDAEGYMFSMLDGDSYTKIKSDLCLPSVEDASGNIEPNWFTYILPDFVIYNSMINVCVGDKRIKSAEKLFMEMKGRKVEPNWVTYNLMINGYAQVGEIEDVERLVAEMKGRNIEPDFVTYNSMINGYAQVKKMEDAERLVAAMKGRNMEPDLVTYNSLINGYAQAKKMEDVERLVTEMKGRNIKPSLITYNTMLNGYVLVEKIEDAENILCEMKERRIEPDLDTYLTIIKGYVKSNRLDDGLKLSLEMEGKGLGRTLDVIIYLDGLTYESNAEYMSDSQLQWVADFWKKMWEEVWARKSSKLASCPGKMKVDTDFRSLIGFFFEN